MEEGVEGPPLGVTDGTREVVDLARHAPELGDAPGEQVLLHGLGSEQAGGRRHSDPALLDGLVMIRVDLGLQRLDEAH